MTTKKIKIFFPIFFLIVSCTDSRDDFSSFYETNLIIRNGISFGECRGYCKGELEVKEINVKYTKSGWDNSSFPDSVFHKNITEQKWNELIGFIDYKKISKMDDVYGCPDCVDGGAEWIELESATFHKKIIFEYDDSLSQVQSLLNELRNIREQFN